MFFWRDIISTYDTAFVNIEAETVRLENTNGWFEDLPLNEEIAYIILTEGLVVIYEN